MITFVGDVHGKISQFKAILQNTQNVVQLGDLGVGLSDTSPLQSERFHFIHGNHDNPSICNQVPGYLGRFGFTGEFFFVSGAYSIDKKLRYPGVDWWDNEQLSYGEGVDAIDYYSRVKPDIMVSHDCPHSISDALSSHHSADQPSKTQYLLQEMFMTHRPKVWIFGHHHVSEEIRFGGTKFVCVPELGIYRL